MIELHQGLKSISQIVGLLLFSIATSFCSYAQEDNLEDIDGLIDEITEEYNMVTIVNSHDMNSVLKIGDTINFIHKGKIWWQGTKETILYDDNPELNTFVFATELTKRLKK